MKNFISIFAFFWAFICVLIIPVTFIGNNQFARQLAKMPFMKVNPKFSGGEPNYEIKTDSLTISINKPVFEALFGQSSEGFVQVKFSGNKILPERIQSNIDYNRDGKPDFSVDINTVNSKTEISILNPDVLELGISSKVKDDWIIRVDIKNR